MTPPMKTVPNLITGSSVHRAIACPPSVVLPRVRTVSEFSAFGTKVHPYVAAIFSRGRAQALAGAPADVVEHLEAVDEMALPPLIPETIKTELAMALDVKTGKGRILGQHLSPQEIGAMRQPDEIAMFTDMVAEREIDGRRIAVIVDFKSGFQDAAKAQENPQLLTAAAAYCSAKGLQDAELFILYTRTGYVDSGTADDFSLPDFVAKLGDTVLRASKARILLAENPQNPNGIEVVAGPHCSYCPSAHCCPAKMTIAHALVAGQLYTGPLVLEPQNVPVVRERLVTLKAMIKDAEEAIGLLAQQRPIPDGSGGWLVWDSDSKDEIDADKVYEVLGGMYGSEVADAAVTLGATKGGIEAAIGERAKALKAAGQTVTKKSLVEAATTELRKAGAFMKMPGKPGVRERSKLSEAQQAQFEATMAPDAAPRTDYPKCPKADPDCHADRLGHHNECVPVTPQIEPPPAVAAPAPPAAVAGDPPPPVAPKTYTPKQLAKMKAAVEKKATVDPAVAAAAAAPATCDHGTPINHKLEPAFKEIHAAQTEIQALALVDKFKTDPAYLLNERVELCTAARLRSQTLANIEKEARRG